MPKKGHTEEQIVAVLRQAEAGEKVSELCRKVGISEATYYAWKKQYAGTAESLPGSLPANDGWPHRAGYQEVEWELRSLEVPSERDGWAAKSRFCQITLSAEFRNFQEARYIAHALSHLSHSASKWERNARRRDISIRTLVSLHQELLTRLGLR